MNMPDNTHKRNTAPLVEARQRQAAQKLAELKATLEDMVSHQEPVTVARVCELSGLSKSYLYQNAEAKKLLAEAKAHNISQPSTTNKTDLLLQYEEIKRKLHESYILQVQLLSSENERLKSEISNLEAEVAYLKSSPKFSIQFIADDSLEDTFYSCHIESVRGNRVFNPIGDTIIDNLLWGQYIISSAKYSFELETQIEGITLVEKSENYLLTISDTVKSPSLIKIVLKA